MTEIEFNRLWQKPKQASLEISAAKGKVMKGQLIHDWKSAIFASLEAQKALKARG